MLPKPYILDLNFDDFENFTDTIRGFNLDYRQLGKGSFRGKLHQVFSGDILLTHAFLNRHIDQNGECPPGMRTLVIPATPDQNFRWHGQNITGNSIGIFPQDCELDAVSGSGFEVFTLSLPEKLLLQTAQLLQNKKLIEIPKHSQVVTVPASAMNMLRNHFQHIYQALTNNPSLLHSPAFIDELNSALPQNFLNTLASTQHNSSIPSPSARSKALKKSLAYIDEYGNEAPKISDLCRAAEVSDRTLIYIFMDHFGIPPKTDVATLNRTHNLKYF